MESRPLWLRSRLAWCLELSKERKKSGQTESRKEDEILIVIDPNVIVKEVTRAWSHC